MIDRRHLFATGAAGAAALSPFFNARLAEAAAAAKAAGDVELRGADGRLERLGTLDLEGAQDFTLGFRLWHAKQARAASSRLFQKVMKEAGVDPDAEMTYEEMLALVEKDPAINMAQRLWLANQQVTWKTLQDYYHANADMYLAEMEAADKAGPGTLELNPKMDVPAYTRHEIHIQPGGYVGDPFAGHIYHYGTNSFYISVIGHNEQDQVHKGTAANLPIPADGKVKRILDMGCGIGQLTVALKERFPEAEVWGIDVGGPMVRYAHMRARDIGADVNFAQRLVEQTGFPDGYFDLVTSYIIHHELPAEITRKTIAEAARVTRKGGVYYPLDFISGGTKGKPGSLYARWFDHRWNNEVWSLEYHSIDFTQEIGKGGFEIVKNAKPALRGFGIRHAIRT
ncbi:MAG: class I SAM-dependent methyltransferase [Rhodospirillaceae bacterium]|nr:class I SAM-dependent methyltransferase [Rhodospirillaceae bacterium]